MKYILYILALLCPTPCIAQRISVGKNGIRKVLKTDSTQTREYIATQSYYKSTKDETDSKHSMQKDAKEPYVQSDIDINIPFSDIKQDNTFAVIIANENYQEEVNVEYARNDGETFKHYCNNILGIPEPNIHLRKDATLNNILTEINWMQNIAKAYNRECNFIVYYAGHGIPDESNGTAYLLPVDGKSDMPETGISINNFYSTLNDLHAEQVTIVLDACFSGTRRGEGMLTYTRGVAIKTKQEKPQGNMIVLTATNGDETAYPYKEKRHGLFTYFLLKKIQETKGNTTYGDLYKYVKKNVSQKSIVINGKPQTPTISVSGCLSQCWENTKIK